MSSSPHAPKLRPQKAAGRGRAFWLTLAAIVAVALLSLNNSLFGGPPEREGIEPTNEGSWLGGILSLSGDKAAPSNEGVEFASGAAAAAFDEAAFTKCFPAADATRLQGRKVALFTCTELQSTLAGQTEVDQAKGLGDAFNAWIEAEFSIVIAMDCSPSSSDGARIADWAQGNKQAAHLIDSAGTSCMQAHSPVAAAVLWAVAAGAAEIALVTQAWPIFTAFMTLPTGQTTLLPARMTESIAQTRPLSLMDHFTARSLQRVNALEDEGKPLVDDICSTPVVPSLQLGLCHHASEYQAGRHSTVAANEAVQAGAVTDALLEHVTPLVLPRGTPVEAAGDHPERPHAFNRFVHRSAAWALAGSGASGSRSWLALQALLSIAGHTATILPPGRLCNMSTAAGSTRQDVADVAAAGAGASSSGVAASTVAKLAQLAQSKAAASAPLLGRPAVAVALAHLDAVTSAVGMATSDAAHLRLWLQQMDAAYAIADTAAKEAAVRNGTAASAIIPLDGRAGVPTSGDQASLLADPSTYVYHRHCWADHSNVRDIVLSINFNNWGNWSAGVLATLRRGYAKHFPLIVAFGGDWTMKAHHPALNAFICASDYEGRKWGWGGGMLGQACGAELIRRYPGRLGYVLSQDDVLWLPWNTLGYDPHRVWAINHTHSQQGDRSQWFYDCNRQDHKLPSGQPHFCYGCYTWSPDLGGKSVGRVHNRFSPKQLAIKEANSGYPNGVTCDLTDAFYVPGRLGAEFAGLCALLREANTEVEMAFTTILDSIEYRRDQEQMRYVNTDKRKDFAMLLGYWDNPHAYKPHKDGLSVLDWFHAMKLSDPQTRVFFEAQIERAARQRLFTRPDMTALRRRPLVDTMHL